MAISDSDSDEENNINNNEEQKQDYQEESVYDLESFKQLLSHHKMTIHNMESIRQSMDETIKSLTIDPSYLSQSRPTSSSTLVPEQSPIPKSSPLIQEYKSEEKTEYKTESKYDSETKENIVINTNNNTINNNIAITLPSPKYSPSISNSNIDIESTKLPLTISPIGTPPIIPSLSTSPIDLSKIPPEIKESEVNENDMKVNEKYERIMKEENKKYDEVSNEKENMRLMMIEDRLSSTLNLARIQEELELEFQKQKEGTKVKKNDQDLKIKLEKRQEKVNERMKLENINAIIIQVLFIIIIIIYRNMQEDF